jgi:hypothetical protein
MEKKQGYLAIKPPEVKKTLALTKSFCTPNHGQARF